MNENIYNLIGLAAAVAAGVGAFGAAIYTGLKYHFPKNRSDGVDTIERDQESSSRQILVPFNQYLEPTNPELFGRELEIQTLDEAWNSPDCNDVLPWNLRV